ncbi:LrgB family protein [Thermoflavimicrobium dichotomicum]|uniref:TIGR00659 family protein n=1 Tax=Thermoflavimicrobium dichotomicum TaxID=46223 RepID=A0A1I3P775_9BACL|nr:LrgB family protein [Thermoflavimicrobium dichotomicum]SFJ17187.1 TIGR00659 family protein [Thermoflavimicrobium dichotomicum]
MKVWISLIMTIMIYLLFKNIYRKWKVIVLIPVFICPLFFIFLLIIMDFPYEQYHQGTKWLTYLLQPATVAFAVPMYKHWHLLKKNMVEILSGVLFGVTFSVFVTMFFSLLFGFSSFITHSLVPRSITTPIAVTITEKIGGNASLTAAFVILTGITGLMLGQFLIRLLRLKTPLAKGMMFGVGAHGIGTSKAFEIGEIEGTFSSLAMILAAIFGVFFIPLLAPLVEKFFALWI